MARIINKVKLNNKNSNVYLPTTSYIDYFKNNYTILYLEGGSKEHPVNITTSKQYMIPNPFPGFVVNFRPEILIQDKWIDPGYSSFQYHDKNFYGEGIRVVQLNDEELYVTTGNNGLLLSNSYTYSLNLSPINISCNSAPFRLKVWKVGLVDLE